MIDLDLWRQRLTAMDMKMAQVDGMGQFSIRGRGSLTFSADRGCALRIELWDDEVDSIRTFDLESQRSVSSWMK